MKHIVETQHPDGTITVEEIEVTRLPRGEE
jgi:hypothetical protein